MMKRAILALAVASLSGCNHPGGFQDSAYVETIDCYTSNGDVFYHADKVRVIADSGAFSVQHLDNSLDHVSGNCVVKGGR